MRKLRYILGETLIEAGAALRLAGWFVLPGAERHPGFQSNAQVDENGHFEMGFADGVEGPPSKMATFLQGLARGERP